MPSSSLDEFDDEVKEILEAEEVADESNRKSQASNSSEGMHNDGL